MSKRQEVFRVLFAYLFFACLFMFQVFLGKVYFPQDYYNQFYPWRYELAETAIKHVPTAPPSLVDAAIFFGPQDAVAERYLRQGEFPFWNPHSGSGFPLFANAQSELFYPVRVTLSTFLDRETALNAYLLLHLWLAGLVFYALARQWNRPLPAFVGGTLWMGGGFMTHYLECRMGAAGVALPLVTLAALKLAERPGKRTAALGALAGTYCLITSHKQFTYYIVLFAALFFLYLCHSLGPDGKSGRRVLWAAVAWVVAFCLSAPPLLSYLELASLSSRPVYSLALKFADNRIYPENLLTFFLPEFLGTPGSGLYLTRVVSKLQTPIELTHHLGVVGMLLTVVGVSRGGKRVRFLSVVSGVLLLACMIPAVYAPMYYLLPGLSHFTPTRILMITTFCFCLLASEGVAKLAESERQTRTIISVTLGVVSALVVGWIVCVQTHSSLYQSAVNFWRNSRVLLNEIPNFTPAEHYQELLVALIPTHFSFHNPAMWLPLTCGAIFLGGLALFGQRRAGRLIPLLILVELVFYFNRWNPVTERGRTFPPYASLELMSGSLNRAVGLGGATPPNSPGAYGLYSPSVYDSLRPQAYANFFQVWQNSYLQQYHMLHPAPKGERFWNWCSLTGVEFVYKDPVAQAEIPPRWAPVYDRELTVYKNPDPPLRAWLVTHWETPPAGGSELELMVNRPFDFRHSALLDQEVSGAGAPGVGGSAKIVEYTANTVVVEADATVSSILVLNDSYYPGWRVKVDGQPRELYRVNSVFRGVKLEPGHHRVEFIFRPTYLPHSAALWALGVILLALLYRDKGVQRAG